MYLSVNHSMKLTFVKITLGKRVSGIPSPLRMGNQGKLWSVCHLSMDALHPMLQKECMYLLMRSSSYASWWSYVTIILSEVSLLNTSRNIIRVCLIDLQKIVAKLLPAIDSQMIWTVISKAVSEIIIMRGSIVSWLIKTLFAYWKIMLGIHPGMMFLLIWRSYATRTIIPRCLYPTGMAMKNDTLLEGQLLILFKFWIIYIFGSCPWVKHEEWWYVVICAHFSTFE